MELYAATLKSRIPKAVGHFFDFIVKSMDNITVQSIWQEISNHGKWDESEILESPALFVALRAWLFTDDTDVKNFIIDWLCQPWEYANKRKEIYIKLVNNFYRDFSDKRPEFQFYKDQVFSFQLNGYAQSWAILRDIDLLAKQSGLKGLIILFDEFEDVITNLNNINYQVSSMSNLFNFHDGMTFTGKTFFAITPTFSQKCHYIYSKKGKWDLDLLKLDSMRTYEMSPLNQKHLEKVSMKILETHCIAHNWNPEQIVIRTKLKQIIKKKLEIPIQGHARDVIKSIVEELDKHFIDVSNEKKP